MIGIIVVCHGNLAQEFISVLEHVAGPQKNIKAMGIYPETDLLKARQELLDMINAVDQGDGIALLTDMFGGTPSNLAISVGKSQNIEVVAGVNLPMLVELIHLRDQNQPLLKTVQTARMVGQNYMNLASAFML